jgi:hypothetical protein
MSLLETNLQNLTTTILATDDAANKLLLSKVFTGTDETASGVMKKGDLFIKSDNTIYVAVGIDPAANWKKLKP